MPAPVKPKLLHGGGDAAALLVQLGAHGPTPRDDLRSLCKTPENFRKAVQRLKHWGLIREAVLITDDGREMLRDLEIESSAPRRNPLPEAGPYPLGPTDEQIEKLKEQAEADRSFGLEPSTSAG